MPHDNLIQAETAEGKVSGGDETQEPSLSKDDLEILLDAVKSQPDALAAFEKLVHHNIYKKRRERKQQPAPAIETDESNLDCYQRDDKRFDPMVPQPAILSKGISDKAFRLYAWMLMHAHNGGKGYCDVGQDRMARELRCSVDTIQRAIDQLEGKFIRTGPDERGNRDVYYFLVRPLQAPSTNPDDGADDE